MSIFRIAVIDQGVDKTHERLAGCTITGFTVRKEPTAYTVIEDSFADDTGHGTGVTGIIHRMVPQIPIVAVKLESFDRRIIEPLLAEAIGECLKDPSIRIINISMGIPEEAPSDSLKEACHTAKLRGVAVVAASYNYPDTPCYPAQLSTVYGVSTGLVKDKFEYGFLEGPVNILAKGTTQRVASLQNGYKIVSGTSYATAHFSGILGRLLLQKGALAGESLEAEIRGRASPGIQQIYYYNGDTKTECSRHTKEELDREGRRLFSFAGKIAFAKNIALFPVSEKEMKTVLEFPDQCRPAISQLIDYPVRLMARAGTAQADPGSQIVRDIGKINFDSFDTLVCGYCLDQLSDVNIDFSIRLIKRCIAENKHFICWDTDVCLLVERLAKACPGFTGEIVVTRVTADELPRVLEYKDLPFVNIPVLAVAGTSNRQGKITTQLRLREILAQEGYRVSLLSTEPQGLLLGADYVFPYGHKNPVGIHEEDWSKFLRIVMRGVQRYNQPDIIITGIQGGLLPRTRTISNDIGHNLAPLHFLLGVSPDAVCCTINPNDSPDLVIRTLQTVRNYCHCPAICCLLTPWERVFLTDGDRQDKMVRSRLLDQAELQERIDFFEEKLGLPVLNIRDDTAGQTILNLVQAAFSGAAVPAGT